MIRGTLNEGISCSAKDPAVVAGSGVNGESYELVLAGAAEATAVRTEKRDIDARATFQTATPSDSFNGTFE